MPFLFLAFLACQDAPAPQPVVAPPVPATKPLTLEVTETPVPQVTVGETRLVLGYHEHMLVELAIKAKKAGKQKLYEQLRDASRALGERFTAAEISVPVDGEFNELKHDDCTGDGKGPWAFALFDPAVSNMGVIGMWDADDTTLYFDGALRQNVFATSQVAHELAHVLEDIPVLEGKAKQRSVDPRERAADELARDVLNLATDGRYQALIDAEVAKLEPSDKRVVAVYVSQELFDLFDAHREHERSVLYQQILLDLNAARIRKVAKTKKERDERLTSLRSDFFNAIATRPDFALQVSWGSDE